MASRIDDGVLIPVAFGEIVDKVTILQIKAERMNDATKLEHVRHELGVLLAASKSLMTEDADLDALVKELKRVNETLWNIEDNIRECERISDFGSRFVELARAVFKTNDRRAEIKRKINLHVGSSIIEEKSYNSY